MSKRIVVLGVSTFANFLLRFLHASGRAETIAVDRDEDRINAITEVVDRPVIGNIRNRELLTEIGVASADMVVVSLGDIEGSLVTVLYLRDLGVEHIVAKALNSEHEHILRLLGVETIVFPERGMAEQVAYRLVFPDVTDSMSLQGGERIIETVATPELIGTELHRQKIYADFGVLLVLVVDSDGAPQVGMAETHEVAGGDRLIFYGTDEALDAFRKSLD